MCLMQVKKWQITARVDVPVCARYNIENVGKKRHECRDGDIESLIMEKQIVWRINMARMFGTDGVRGVVFISGTFLFPFAIVITF